jgi:hypothetical protein
MTHNKVLCREDNVLLYPRLSKTGQLGFYLGGRGAEPVFTNLRSSRLREFLLVAWNV